MGKFVIKKLKIIGEKKSAEICVLKDEFKLEESNSMGMNNKEEKIIDLFRSCTKIWNSKNSNYHEYFSIDYVDEKKLTAENLNSILNGNFRIRTLTLDEYIEDYARTHYPELKFDGLDSIKTLGKIIDLRGNNKKR